MLTGWKISQRTKKVDGIYTKEIAAKFQKLESYVVFLFSFNSCYSVANRKIFVSITVTIFLDSCSTMKISVIFLT